MERSTIAVTGAAGFLGRPLVAALATEGHAVVVLTRRPDRARAAFPPARFPTLTVAAWNPAAPGPWARALEGAAAVIHLSGAPVLGRWTPEFRSAIRDSRVLGTRSLVAAIAGLDAPPAALVSASSCRYYGVGERGDLDEASPPGPGTDFLAAVCRDWEAEAVAAETAGLRVARLRFGIALDLTPSLRTRLPTLRRFIGGRIGSGRQWISWIHRADAVAAIRRAALDPAMAGPFNVAAPNPVRMDTMSAAFGRVAGGLIRLPMPGLVLEGLIGDGATLVLEGQRAVPRRLLEAGFRFLHPDIDCAARAIFA